MPHDTRKARSDVGSHASGAHRHPGQFPALTSIGAVRSMAEMNLMDVAARGRHAIPLLVSRHERGGREHGVATPIRACRTGHRFCTICRGGSARTNKTYVAGRVKPNSTESRGLRRERGAISTVSSVGGSRAFLRVAYPEVSGHNFRRHLAFNNERHRSISRSESAFSTMGGRGSVSGVAGRAKRCFHTSYDDKRQREHRFALNFPAVLANLLLMPTRRSPAQGVCDGCRAGSWG